MGTTRAWLRPATPSLCKHTQICHHSTIMTKKNICSSNPQIPIHIPKYLSTCGKVNLGVCISELCLVHCLCFGWIAFNIGFNRLSICQKPTKTLAMDTICWAKKPCLGKAHTSPEWQPTMPTDGNLGPEWPPLWLTQQPGPEWPHICPRVATLFMYVRLHRFASLC